MKSVLLVTMACLGSLWLIHLPYRIDTLSGETLRNVYFAIIGLFALGLLIGILEIKSAKKCKNRNKALISTMGVLIAIVGLICFIVCFSGSHAVTSAQNRCINNVRRIEAAKEDLAQRSGITNGTQITWHDIAFYFTNGFPKCPEGGMYSLGKIGEPVVCSIPDHRLPRMKVKGSVQNGP